MQEFVDKICETLKSNGFPDKRVSLPTDKMYEAADKRGLSFNQVLKHLKDELNIDADIGADKIVFAMNVEEVVSDEDPMQGLDPAELMRQAQEMMSQMDPEELKKLQETFNNMSPDQMDEMMRKGKDLGLI